MRFLEHPATLVNPTADLELATKQYVDGHTHASAVSKYITAIGTMNVSGAAVTSSVVTHNLGTRHVSVTVFNSAAPYNEVECDVEHTDANSVTLYFGDALPYDVDVVVMG